MAVRKFQSLPEPEAAAELPVKTSLRLARNFKAGQIIGSPRVIMFKNGLAFLFNPAADLNSVEIVGVSENSAEAWDDVVVVQSGEITLPKAFQSGAIYYAAVGGLLTAKLPTCGISVKIGIGVDADTMLVRMSEPLILI